MVPFSSKPIWIPYPLPCYEQCGDRDMEFSYLEELYPEKIKQYQRKVNEEVDQYDYRGSVIYDEYPDRMTLYRMAVNITEKIKVAETMEIMEQRPVTTESEETIQKDMTEHTGDGRPCELIELVQILLYHEIAKRKRNTKQVFWVDQPRWD